MFLGIFFFLHFLIFRWLLEPQKRPAAVFFFFTLFTRSLKLYKIYAKVARDTILNMHRELKCICDTFFFGVFSEIRCPYSNKSNQPKQNTELAKPQMQIIYIDIFDT